MSDYLTIPDFLRDQDNLAAECKQSEVILPCPCCDSTNTTKNLWSLDSGEVDAIECNDCLCGAPLTSWQNRNEAQCKTS